MTDRAALLQYAEQVLDGDVPLGSSGPRTAALLTRCALEDWLDERSADWVSSTYPYPSTRSKLVILETLGDIDIGARARRIWESLSRIAHHHAYELQPSAAEVRHLLKQAREVVGAKVHG